MTTSVRSIALALVAATLAACQLKSTPAPSTFITAEPSAFVIKSVDKYNDPNAAATSSLIVVVKATYTNQEAVPESISPDKFTLLDPDLMAIYYGLSGGDVNIPSMSNTHLDPGKSIDITVGFRVPGTMSTARLTYHQ
jgi:hypothetical protein